MSRLTLYFILGSLLMSFGCKTLDPEPVPQLTFEVPETFSARAENPDDFPLIQEWWQSLNSPELDAMIQMGLDKNYDLNVSKARISQAEASLEKERAQLKPSLGFSLGGDKKQTRIKNSQTRSNTGSHSWDGSLTGAYTVDLWGEARAGVEAKNLALEAANQDLKDASLTLSTEIAQTWVNLISVRSRKKILENQIKINTTHLDLQKLRFLHGKASALDVSQQREALAEALSLVPLLEKEASELLNTLGFLMGTPPGVPVQVSTQELPTGMIPAEPGLPADLLANRSDIRAVRVRLLSAVFDVEAAKADLLPSFTLSAAALFSSGSLDLLFQNWVASLGAAFAGPLFDGGLRQAEVKRVRAKMDELIHLYARTVARAIKEVEDSLVGIRRQKEYIERLTQELDAARLTLKDARVQYLNGQTSYLNYLTAWVGIERLERQLVSEHANLVKEKIVLYRTIGWQLPENKTVTPAIGAE
ncbi:MAG: efflux transporter outer membrane subunit [Desulfobacter sp.]|nr:MAG: efflux transporter outer membrane subunit [Desulfobacter sp.]